MALAAVLFDIDGTLVDSNGLHVRAWVQAFAQGGYRIDEGPIAGQIGKGADNLVPALLPGVDPQTVKTIGGGHDRIFKERYLDQVRPFPGARDLIARVQEAGAKVVLASSASQAELDHYIGLLDLADLVDAATTIDDVPHSKPAPDIFVAAREKIGEPPVEHVVVIGDSPYDMAAAGYVGMRTAAVMTGGFAEAALRAAGAGAIFDDVAALLARYDESPLAR